MRNIIPIVPVFLGMYNAYIIWILHLFITAFCPTGERYSVEYPCGKLSQDSDLFTCVQYGDADMV